MRVLLIEDDPLLGHGVQAGLIQAGFAVDWVQDGLAGDSALTGASFSAVVLDLGLPKLGGLDLLGRWRRRGESVPVLVLTARDALDDRVRGLDAGADDYLVKPFRLEELAARLRALVRRSHGSASSVLRIADVELDLGARTVQCGGRPVDLAGREFDVLRELMLNAGRVLTREQISERLYAWGEEAESNTIEVHVHRLRRKLSRELIRTIRGVGYLIPRSPDA